MYIGFALTEALALIGIVIPFIFHSPLIRSGTKCEPTGGSRAMNTRRYARGRDEPADPGPGRADHRDDRVRHRVRRPAPGAVPRIQKTLRGAHRRDRGRPQEGRGRAGRGEPAARAVPGAAGRGPPRGRPAARGGQGAGRADHRRAPRARRRPRRSAWSRRRTRRSRPTGSRPSPRCAPRSARSRSSWPAGSSASRWRTRPGSAGTVDRFLDELEEREPRRTAPAR